MKIEKINNNQIKCTLNKSDLASRQIKMSELAYGTEKAKKLFRDMMQQAAAEFGFEAEDIPLMIEAIPVSADCIILVITKVEDPEELDTRFSKFAPFDDEEEIDGGESDAEDLPFIDFANIYKQVKKELSAQLDAINAANAASGADAAKADGSGGKEFIPLPESIGERIPAKPGAAKAKHQFPSMAQPLKTVFTFESLDDIISVARLLKSSYKGSNVLYRHTDSRGSRYYLTLSQSTHTPEEFAIVCNVLSEYGSMEKYNYASEAYYNEHFDKVIAKRALQKLGMIV